MDILIPVHKYNFTTYQLLILIGIFKNGKRHGSGKITSREGKIIFNGEFLNDTKNGIGKEYFLDGSSYEGMYQNGKKNGKGIINNTYIT